jgi:alpha-1,6-mannosyltransferase
VKKTSLIYLSISITLLTFGFAAVRFSFLHPVVLYTITFIGTSIVFCWMCWLIFRIELPQNYLFICLGLALCIRLFFLSLSPIGSDDIYRYIWDGKVQTFGMNPYSYAPNADSLRHLHSDLLPSSINHPDLKTLYFPFSEWIFFLCYQISGEAVWGYKLILLLSEIAVIIGLFLLTRRLYLSSKYILFYAFCPLSVFQFAIDSHLDELGFPFLIFCLLAYFNKKTILASLLLGLSISLKPIGLVVLPILIIHEQTWKKRMILFILPLFIFLIQFLPYLFHSTPWDALFTFAKHWTFNGIVFESLNFYFLDNQKTRLICLLLLGLLLLLLYSSKKPIFDKLYLSVLLLLLFSPVVHPWYIAWLLLFLPITHQWSGILYVATASLTSLTILNYKLVGVWKQEPVVLLLEYLPVIVLLFYELRYPQSTAALLDKNVKE